MRDVQAHFAACFHPFGGGRDRRQFERTRAFADGRQNPFQAHFQCLLVAVQSQFDGSPGQTLAFSVEQALRDERRLVTAAPHHTAWIAGFPRFSAVRSCFRLCINIINMFGHNAIIPHLAVGQPEGLINRRTLFYDGLRRTRSLRSMGHLSKTFFAPSLWPTRSASFLQPPVPRHKRPSPPVSLPKSWETTTNSARRNDVLVPI